MNGALAGQTIAAQPGQPLIIMPFSVMAGYSPSKIERSSEGPNARPSTRFGVRSAGGVRRSVIECEPAVWLNEVDGRDKPGMTVRAMVRNSQ
jgi:hypothetical protein